MMAAQFREVFGDGWLEPVHPVPPVKLRNDLILALRARKNLLVKHPAPPPVRSGGLLAPGPR